MRKAITINMKTIRSFDLTTKCLRSCPYCYITYHRNKDFFAVVECDHCEYTGEILRMRPETIARLNSIGGLRCFSNADYQPRFYDTMKQMLDDCLKVGLSVKVITKQEQFILDFHDHPAVRVINVSVDSLGLKNAGFSMRKAKQLKAYPKVRIRSVILNETDFEMFKDSDIVTFNHGANGFHNFSSRERLEIAQKYGIEDKTCCLTGKCLTCKVKCG